MAGVDSISDLLPVFMAKTAAVQIEMTLTPGMDESGSMVESPRVFAKWNGGRHEKEGERGGLWLVGNRGGGGDYGGFCMREGRQGSVIFGERKESGEV